MRESLGRERGPVREKGLNLLPASFLLFQDLFLILANPQMKQQQQQQQQRQQLQFPQQPFDKLGSSTFRVLFYATMSAPVLEPATKREVLEREQLLLPSIAALWYFSLLLEMMLSSGGLFAFGGSASAKVELALANDSWLDCENFFSFDSAGRMKWRGR